MAVTVVKTIREVLESATGYSPDDLVIVTDTSEAFEKLDADSILSLAAKGADTLSAKSLFQWSLEQSRALIATEMSLHPNGYGGVVRDTPARISALTVDQIASLGAKGFKLLNTTDSDPIVFSIEQLRASANLNSSQDGIFDGVHVTLLDSAANLNELSLIELGRLQSQGVTLIDVKDHKLGWDRERLDKLGVGIKFADADEISLVGPSLELAALDVTELNLYHSKGVDCLHATDPVSLTIAQALTLAASQLRYAAEDRVTVQGPVGSFTAAQIAALGAKGVDVLDATSDVVLNYANAAALAGTSMVFAAEDKVTVVDSMENISRLTSAQIARLAQSGADALDSTTNAIVLTASQLAALGSVQVGADDRITLADSAENISALTAAQIARLALDGVDVLDSMTDAISLTVDQLAALGSIQFAAEDRVAISWTGTAKGDTVSGTRFDDNIDGLAGNDRLSGGDGNDRLSGGAGYDVLTGGSGGDVFIFDTKLSAKAKPDRIVDFDHRKDFVHLESSIFSRLGKNKSDQVIGIKKAFFKVAAQAADSNDYLLFNSKTKVLSYDQDGSGKAFKPVAIALLQKGAQLTAADILLI